MAKGDTHEITTIKQLVEVVNRDNLEVLKADLNCFLDLAVACDEMGIGGDDMFQWTDDDTPGLTGVTLHVTHDEDDATTHTIHIKFDD